MKAIFLYNREGVVQGDQLYMVAYGIGVILLTKLPKASYTDVTQPWYTDNYDALDTFDNIGLYVNSLEKFVKKFVTGCGYYPEPPKIVLIVQLDNPAGGKDFGLCHRFKV